MTTLVVIPCGQKKIWDSEPKAGPTRAFDAYQGPPFKVNREYAVRFAPKSWVVLSAKYGFISPEFHIPENYNVTFNDPETTPISEQRLAQQVREDGLDRFDTVIVLGSKAYADKVRASFRGTQSRVAAPLEPLKPWPPGIRMQAVRRAIDTNTPFTA